MLGFTQAECEGTVVTTFLTPESALRVSAELATVARKYAEDGHPLTRTYYTEEFLALHKSGPPVTIEVTAFIWQNEKNRCLEVYGLLRDISDRKRAEATIRAGEARLRLAARAAGLGIWLWDFADGSLDWDERMCEIYAVPMDERSPDHYFNLWHAHLHPDDRVQAETTLAEALRTGTEWDHTFRIVLPDGRVRHLHTVSVTEYSAQGVPSPHGRHQPG
ncbi:MAG: PAS domain-containing protein [Anaerolineales bacterium]|nr:PAS domain-containing protein [Anaerolineales bacterium]